MLSLISSRVLSQRIFLAAKPFRIVLFFALCLLVIAPSLPAQAQSFNSNGFAGHVRLIGFHSFKIEITAVPANTTMVSAIATGGGITSNWGKDFGNKTVPIVMQFGKLSGHYLDKDNEFINPGTTYTVKLQAQNRRGLALASASLTVTTLSHGAGSFPGVDIHNLVRTDHSISFDILPFAGANFYKVSRFSGDRGSFRGVSGGSCSATRRIEVSPAATKEPGPQGRAAIPAIYTFEQTTPANRNGNVLTWDLKVTGIASSHAGDASDNLHVRYCNLPADRTFHIQLEAWRKNADNSANRLGATMHKLRTLPMPSPQLLGSDSQDNELNPSATPIYIEVDYPGNPLTDVSLSWEAVSGASGYSLEVVGGNSESYAFPLGAGATSHRVNGLTPGADYTAYLTAYLQDGGKRSGEAHFGMADPPPTSTPIPPTATPIPQQSSEDSVQDQSPPQLQYSPMQAEEDEEDEPQPSGPYASLIADILVYRAEQDKESDHYIRWTRTLAALWDKVSHTNPMTLSEAQGYLNRGWNRWQAVVDALTALNPPTNTPVPPPPPTNTPVPPPPPTNTPVPPAPTNTPVPPPPEPEPEKEESYKVPQSLIDDIKAWRKEQAADSDHAIRWTRVLAAFGEADHSNPMSSSEAKIYRDERGWSRWIDVVTALEKLGK